MIPLHYTTPRCRRQRVRDSCSVFVSSAGPPLKPLLCGLVLRLAHDFATTATSPAAIGVRDRWNDKSVQEQDCGCENQKGTFHGGFLLSDCELDRDDFMAATMRAT
jgi:hypothetical protein